MAIFVGSSLMATLCPAQCVTGFVHSFFFPLFCACKICWQILLLVWTLTHDRLVRDRTCPTGRAGHSLSAGCKSYCKSVITSSLILILEYWCWVWDTVAEKRAKAIGGILFGSFWHLWLFPIVLWHHQIQQSSVLASKRCFHPWLSYTSLSHLCFFIPRLKESVGMLLPALWNEIITKIIVFLMFCIVEFLIKKPPKLSWYDFILPPFLFIAVLGWVDCFVLLW